MWRIQESGLARGSASFGHIGRAGFRKAIWRRRGYGRLTGSGWSGMCRIICGKRISWNACSITGNMGIWISPMHIFPRRDLRSADGFEDNGWFGKGRPTELSWHRNRSRGLMESAWSGRRSRNSSGIRAMRRQRIIMMRMGIWMCRYLM